MSNHRTSSPRSNPQAIPSLHWDRLALNGFLLSVILALLAGIAHAGCGNCGMEGLSRAACTSGMCYRPAGSEYGSNKGGGDEGPADGDTEKDDSTECTIQLAPPANHTPPFPSGAEQQTGTKNSRKSDPIVLFSGDFQLSETDLSIPGRGIDLMLTRNYRSRSGMHSRFSTDIPKAAQPLGANWDHSFNIRATFWANGTFNQYETITFLCGNGRVMQAGYDVSRGFHVNPKLNCAIYLSATTRVVTMVTADGAVYTFAPFSTSAPFTGGELESITDRNGNQVTFSYDTVGSVVRLAQVADDIGNEMNFEYHDDTSSPQANSARSHLLWRVTDHAGRSVEYIYDFVSIAGGYVKEKLVQVVSPVVDSVGAYTLPSEHERFPSGRAKFFEYAAENANPDIFWDGQLIKMWSGNGDLVVENAYSAPTIVPTVQAMRVTRQVWGDGAYNYKVTDRLGDPADIAVDDFGESADYCVWINNREGQIIRLDFDGGMVTHKPGRLVNKVEYVGIASNTDSPSWAELDSSGNVVTWNNGPGSAIRTGDADRVTQYTFDPYWYPESTLFMNGDRSWTERIYHTNGTADPRIGHEPCICGVENGTFQLTTQLQYGHTLGSGHPFNSPTSFIDPRGLVSLRRHDASGNLTTVYHDLPIGTSTSISDTTAASLAAAVEHYSYNSYGQVTSWTRPARDILGSGGVAVSQVQIDRFEYGTVTGLPSYGRLTATVVDDGGLELRTEYDYDAVGNVRKIIEPDGNTTIRVINQIGELVRLQRWDVDPEAYSTTAVLLYQEDSYYDANGNLVRTDTLNIDGDNQIVTANPEWTTVTAHDLLNRVIAVAKEVSPVNLSLAPLSDGTGRFAVPDGTAWSNTELAYNSNGKLIEASLPEAVDGRQVSNKIEYFHDEFDRVYRMSKGDGLLVVQRDYDVKGRVSAVTVSPDDSGMARTTTVEYDPANRPVLITDAMGNEAHLTWSPGDELLVIARVGQLDDATADNTGAVLLAYEEREYDPRRRLIERRIGVFEPGDLTPTQVPTAFSSYSTEYNSDSSVRRTIAPVGTYPGLTATETVTEFLYDTAGRLVFQSDAIGNARYFEYTSGSNVLSVIAFDVVGSGTEEYHIKGTYDGLDRLNGVLIGAETGGVSNETVRQFDSRSNVVKEIDPRENVTRAEYDGLSRVTAVIREMTSTGAGGGGAAANPEITESYEYDDSSRLVALEDDAGNRTEYVYDGADRQVQITMPDGTEHAAVYDSAGNMEETTDPRGVVVTNTFDLLNRLVSRSIALASAPDVGGVVSETFSYDGTGRVRSAENTDTQVQRFYDSRSLVVEEAQNADVAGSFPTTSTRIVQYVYDAASNPSVVAYPNGRELFLTFDAINRLDGIYPDDTYTSAIAGYTYSGVNRIAARTFENGIEAIRLYTGYDGSSSDPQVVPGDKGFGTLASIEHLLTATSATIDHRNFARDASGNKVRQADIRSGFVDRRHTALAYDSADRLIQANGSYPDPLTTKSMAGTFYTLDGQDNRTEVASSATPGPDGTDLSGSVIGPYVALADHALNNQYTTSPNRVFEYDANGNMAIRAELAGPDFDNNYTVATPDIFAFLSAFFAQQGLSSPPEPPGSLTADWDGDGTVATPDIFAFLADHSPANGSTRLNDHFTYDYRNRLIGVERREGSTIIASALFTYDAFDRRVVEVIETDSNSDGTLDTTRTTQFVHGGQMLWQVLEEFDGVTDAAAVVASHAYGVGLDELIRTDRDIDADTVPDALYFHQDEMGSVRAVTDSTGAVLERYDYGDFGTPVVLEADAVTVRSGTVIGNQVMYTGRGWLAEFDMYDYRHRFMDPRIGRFIQRDPIGYEGGINVNAYVGHSPYNYGDPLGLQSIDVGGSINGFVSGLVRRGVNFAMDRFTRHYEEFGRSAIPRWLTGESEFLMANYEANPIEHTALLGFDAQMSVLTLGQFQPVRDWKLYDFDTCSWEDRWGRRSVQLGTVATLVAGGLGVGQAVQAPVVASRYVQVSRWGRPGLKEGDWVMTGGKSIVNYLKSGKYQPGLSNQFAKYSSGETFTVAREALRWPGVSPWNIVKGILGQRRYFP